MEITGAERAALARALALAATPGVPVGPNPRVGCVLLDESGAEIAEGFHRGAGTPHAEVAALACLRDPVDASARGPGAHTAVVTLEPCHHQGRTGPCSLALIEAGISRVVFAQADPNPRAAGGAEALRQAGIEVVGPVDPVAGEQLNRAWSFAMRHRRPMVTWKFATTLDGRSAAADGTSRWISSRAARLDTHRLRGVCDALVVGANTVAVDDPELTVRDEVDEPVQHQPLRVVLGTRDLPDDRRIFDDRAETVQLRTHDVPEVLAELFAMDRQHVFLEGGPHLAAAFLTAGCIDEVVVYVAPKLLGAGTSAIADLGITTITEAIELSIAEVATVGHGAEANVRITLRSPEQEQA